MCFNQDGAIWLNGNSLKLVDQFIYFYSNTLFIENDVNIYIGKAWYAMTRLTIIWKSDHSDKRGILPSYNYVNTITWLHHLNLNKIPGEKATWELNKDTACCLEQILEAKSYMTAAAGPLTSYFTNHPRQTKHVRHCSRSKSQLISNVLLWTPIHGHTSVG